VCRPHVTGVGGDGTLLELGSSLRTTAASHPAHVNCCAVQCGLITPSTRLPSAVRLRFLREGHRRRTGIGTIARTEARSAVPQQRMQTLGPPRRADHKHAWCVSPTRCKLPSMGASDTYPVRCDAMRCDAVRSCDGTPLVVFVGVSECCSQPFGLNHRCRCRYECYGPIRSGEIRIAAVVDGGNVESRAPSLGRSFHAWLHGVALTERTLVAAAAGTRISPVATCAHGG
jgi:hypothetical protein